MSITTVAVLCFLSFIIGFLISITIFKKDPGNLKTENKHLHGKIKDMKENLEKIKSEKEDLVKKYYAEKPKKELKESLLETFKNLSLEALNKNSETFLAGTKEKIKPLTSNLEQKITEFNKSLLSYNQQNLLSFKELKTEIKNLSQSNSTLQITTDNLKNILKSPTKRGNWGEYELENIVELSGMSQYFSYETQKGTTKGRPDMLIKLPKEGQIPIDAKFPFDHYIKAIEEKDKQKSEKHMKNHLKAIKNHIKALKQRNYESIGKPQLTIMFLPNEAILSTAFELDKNLFENSLDNNVLLATPITLYALLKTIAYGWHQLQLETQTKDIVEKSKELYSRLEKIFEYLNKHKKNLGDSIGSYNDLVGSFERRLVPQLRKFKNLKGYENKKIELEKITENPRTPETFE